MLNAPLADGKILVRLHREIVATLRRPPTRVRAVKGRELTRMTLIIA